MEIRKIPSRLCLPLRQRVLRHGKPLETCVFRGDDDPSSCHLGAFEKEQLIGIVSLLRHKNEQFAENKQYQLRGMAVLPEFKGHGWGSKLLRAVDKDVDLQGVEILWCNAREIAVGFYEKHGFKILGTSFEIDGIGKHYLMYKKPKEDNSDKQLSSLLL